MTRLFVCADDLTGALDTGVQFAKAGAETKVCFWQDFDRVHFEPATEVIVCDSESRHLSPTQAKARVRDLFATAKSLGCTAFYKKTDSTLRGPIGAEIQGMCEALAPRPVMFIPAYPQAGRITRNGTHYVDGVPLAETSFARDAQNPILNSQVSALLRQSGLQCPLQNAPASGEATAPVQAVFLFDAMCDADLDAIADQLEQQDRLTVTAGCAGFARALAAKLFSTSRPHLQTEPIRKAQPLILCGSAHEVSLRQLSFYRHRQAVYTHILSRRQKDPAYWQSEKAAANLQPIAKQLATQPVIIQSALRPGDIDPTVDASTVAAAFAAIAAKLHDDRLLFHLIVFGGDTLAAVLNRLGSRMLRPFAEIAPGIVAARLKDETFPGILVSKAGGLGTPEALRQIETWLQKKEGD